MKNCILFSLWSIHHFVVHCEHVHTYVHTCKKCEEANYILASDGTWIRRKGSKIERIHAVLLRIIGHAYFSLLLPPSPLIKMHFSNVGWPGSSWSYVQSNLLSQSVSQSVSQALHHWQPYKIAYRPINPCLFKSLAQRTKGACISEMHRYTRDTFIHHKDRSVNVSLCLFF